VRRGLRDHQQLGEGIREGSVGPLGAQGCLGPGELPVAILRGSMGPQMRTDRAHAVQVPVRRESPLARFDPEVDRLEAGIRQIAPHLLGVDLVADDRVGELGQNRWRAGARERHEFGVVPRPRAE
jgi:hypothetical protein